MFYKLECLRGVAACLMILFHSPFNYGTEQSAFFYNSYLFVDFFFVLSGFVMALAYTDKIADGLPFREYVLARLGRIYPLHLAMLLVWAPYILIKQYLYMKGWGGTDQFEHSNLASFVSNLTLTHSLGLHHDLSWNYPSWSISVEFFSYLIFFALTCSLDSKQTLYMPLVFTAICYFIVLSVDKATFDITYDYGLFRCAGAFYCGVFAYRLRKKSHFSGKSLSFTMMSALELMIVLAIITIIPTVGNEPSRFILLIAVFTCAIFVFSSISDGIVGKLLNLHPIRQIGLWSYSIYMVHAIIVAGVSNIFEFILHIDPESVQGVQSLMINTGIVLITIFCSRFTFIYIEDHFRYMTKTKLEQMYIARAQKNLA